MLSHHLQCMLLTGKKNSSLCKDVFWQLLHSVHSICLSSLDTDSHSVVTVSLNRWHPKVYIRCFFWNQQVAHILSLRRLRVSIFCLVRRLLASGRVGVYKNRRWISTYGLVPVVRTLWLLTINRASCIGIETGDIADYECVTTHVCFLFVQ